MADDDIKAQTPDGVTHVFPAGTPDSVVDGAIKQHIALTTGQGMMEQAAGQAKQRATSALDAKVPQPVAPKEGEDFSDTMQRGIAMGRKMSPDQRRMANVTTEGQGIRQAPAVLGMAAAAPFATMEGIPGLLAETGAGAGASYLGGRAIGETPREAGGEALSTGIGTLGGRALGKVGRGLFSEEGPATRLANRIIGTPEKAVSFGANPGRAVLEQSPSASVGGIARQAGEVQGELGSKIGDAVQRATKPVDFGTPIQASLAKEKVPDIANRAFDVITQTQKDLGIKNLSNMTPQEAFRFKQAIQGNTAFSEQPALRASVNRALQRMYGGMSDALSSSVPELKELNPRYADATSASNVTGKLNRRNTAGQLGLQNIQLSKPLDIPGRVLASRPSASIGALQLGSMANRGFQGIGPGNVGRAVALAAPGFEDEEDEQPAVKH